MYCTRKVKEDLIWVGADDRRLACFEGVYGVPDGVSYNSYVMLDEKVAIFDTVDKAVYQTYFENIEHALGLRGEVGMSRRVKKAQLHIIGTELRLL